MKDYYKILGLTKDCTDEDIKKSYRKLASIYHPDVSNDPEANKKMAEINEAYSVLKDPSKRASYDQYGSSSTSETYNYNPNFNNYEYYQGFVFKRSPFRFIRAFIIIGIIVMLYSFVNRIFNNNYGSNYSFSYIAASSDTLAIKRINTSSVFTKVKEVSIPEQYVVNRRYSYDITAIGESAFIYDTNIEVVILTNKINHIGKNAFYGCKNLKTIKFKGTKAEFDSILIESGNEYLLNANIIFI